MKINDEVKAVLFLSGLYSLVYWTTGLPFVKKLFGVVFK